MLTEDGIRAQRVALITHLTIPEMEDAIIHPRGVVYVKISQ